MYCTILQAPESGSNAASMQQRSQQTSSTAAQCVLDKCGINCTSQTPTLTPWGASQGAVLLPCAASPAARHVEHT